MTFEREKYDMYADFGCKHYRLLYLFYNTKNIEEIDYDWVNYIAVYGKQDVLENKFRPKGYRLPLPITDISEKKNFKDAIIIAGIYNKEGKLTDNFKSYFSPRAEAMNHSHSKEMVPTSSGGYIVAFTIGLHDSRILHNIYHDILNKDNDLLFIATEIYDKDVPCDITVTEIYQFQCWIKYLQGVAIYKTLYQPYCEMISPCFKMDFYVKVKHVILVPVLKSFLKKNQYLLDKGRKKQYRHIQIVPITEKAKTKIAVDA